jgi:hypothetical protein
LTHVSGELTGSNERVSPIAMMRAHVASRHTNARNAAVTAFTQPIRMSPPAWTAPTVQMSAHPPPHRAAMEGRFSACFACGRTKIGWGKEPVKKREALSIFEAEMLSQSVSYDFFPTIDIRKVIY